MSELHPDKLVGVTKAIYQRPRRPRPSAEVAAIRAASTNAQRIAPSRPVKGQPGISPNRPVGGPMNGPGILENLAFQLREAHNKTHLDRLARFNPAAMPGFDPARKVGHSRPAQDKPRKPASPSQSVGQGQPVLNFHFGKANA